MKRKLSVICMLTLFIVIVICVSILFISKPSLLQEKPKQLIIATELSLPTSP